MRNGTGGIATAASSAASASIRSSLNITNALSVRLRPLRRLTSSGSLMAWYAAATAKSYFSSSSLSGSFAHARVESTKGISPANGSSSSLPRVLYPASFVGGGSGWTIFPRAAAYSFSSAHGETFAPFVDLAVVVRYTFSALSTSSSHSRKGADHSWTAVTPAARAASIAALCDGIRDHSSSFLHVSEDAPVSCAMRAMCSAGDPTLTTRSAPRSWSAARSSRTASWTSRWNAGVVFDASSGSNMKHGTMGVVDGRRDAAWKPGWSWTRRSPTRIQTMCAPEVGAAAATTARADACGILRIFFVDSFRRGADRAPRASALGFGPCTRTARVSAMGRQHTDDAMTRSVPSVEIYGRAPCSERARPFDSSDIFSSSLLRSFRRGLET